MVLKPMQRAAVLGDLIDRLNKAGSWCGETHVQKATYFLQEGSGVPVGEDFVLYKHGPFSFSLRDTLGGLKADGILAMVTQPYPYGPSFELTDAGRTLCARFPKTLNHYRQATEKTVGLVGAKNVNLLERLSTALYVIRNSGINAPDKIAEEVNELKPHVGLDSARAAAADVIRWINS